MWTEKTKRADQAPSGEWGGLAGIAAVLELRLDSCWQNCEIKPATYWAFINPAFPIKGTQGI